MITDPPYLINYQTHRRQDKDHKFCKAIQNDDNPQLIIDLVPLLYDVMKDNTPLYMFCGSDKVDFFKQEVEKCFTVKNLIVWDKGNHTAGDLGAQYGKRYEFIIYANKGRAPFQPDMPRLEDIWHFPKVAGKEQIHQNQKPTNLLSQIINQHTKEGDLIRQRTCRANRRSKNTNRHGRVFGARSYVRNHGGGISRPANF